MTTITDATQFPEEVRARLEDLDRRIEGAQTEEQDHQRALGRLQADLAQSLTLRAAIVETAEAVLAVWAPKIGDQIWGGGVAVTPPEQEAILARKVSGVERRRRRDIRGEVLTILEDGKKLSVKGIADLIGVGQTSVEKALAVHERNGKLVEKPEGVWSAAPGPVLTPVLGHAQNAPLLGVPYVEASPMSPLGRVIKDPTLEPVAPKPIPSADHVLDFIVRAGDMGVSDGQLERIGCTDSILAILRHNETAAQGVDGRWRAVVEVTEMVEDEA